MITFPGNDQAPNIIILSKEKIWKSLRKDFKGITTTTTKSLQSCPTLCDPIDGSPPGFPVPGNLQARTLEWVAISFSNAWKWKVKVKSLSRVWLLFATPWTAASQAPPSLGFSKQEYWSGMPLPSPWTIVHGVTKSQTGLSDFHSILISAHINYAHFNVLQSYFLRFILSLLSTLLCVNLFSLGGLLICFILVYICRVSHCCQCFFERKS